VAVDLLCVLGGRWAVSEDDLGNAGVGVRGDDGVQLVAVEGADGMGGDRRPVSPGGVRVAEVLALGSTAAHVALAVGVRLGVGGVDRDRRVAQARLGLQHRRHDERVQALQQLGVLDQLAVEAVARVDGNVVVVLAADGRPQARGSAHEGDGPGRTRPSRRGT
jgi:hypothetical protein